VKNPRPHILLSVDFDFFVRELDAWHFDHGEHDLYRLYAWTFRERAFRMDGIDLRAETSLRYAEPHPAHFFGALERLGFDFSDLGAVVADSHRYAYNLFKVATTEPSRTRLVNFDAHHDLFYSAEKLRASVATDMASCENWHMLTLLNHAGLRSLNVYPGWLGLREWDRSLGKLFRGKTEAMRSLAAHLHRWTGPCVWGDPRIAAAAGRVEKLFIAKSSAWTPTWHDAAFASFCRGAAKRFRVPLTTPFTAAEGLDPLQLRDASRGARRAA
jgi:hypothetical protein